MNKFKICLIFYGLLVVISPLCHGTGMPVFDVSVYITALQELQKMDTEAKHLSTSLKGLAVGQYEWSNAQELLDHLGNTINKTGGIAYSTENLNQEFKKSYPGYVAPKNYSQQYRDNVNQTQNTLGGTLNSMSASAKDFENDNNRLKKLQTNVQSAEGQTQAIQASAQIASEVVSQIQLLRQTVMAQSSAQTAYYAQQVQAEASNQAMLAEVVGAGSTEVPKYGTSGNYLTVPNF